MNESSSSQVGSGSPTYLAGLLLHGRRVVVVGGGKVARRRVPKLLAAGARVELISPEVDVALRSLADSGALLWQAREFTAKGGFTENLYATRKQARDGAGTPACPDCSKPMRQRIAKQGKQAGEAFWGCSGYPECKGVRPV